MALDFPASPTNGQTFGNYIYDTSIPGWRNVNSGEGVGLQFKSGLIPVSPTSVTVDSGSATVTSTGFITFSAATVVRLNGVFTSSYKHYRVVMRTMGNTLGAAVYFRYRSSGTDRTTSYYYGGYMCRETGALSGWAGNGTGQFDFSRTWTGNLGTTLAFDLFSPFDSGSTSGMNCLSWANDGSGGFSLNTNGLYSQTDSNDGFSMWVSSGNFTGSLQVYGYN